MAKSIGARQLHERMRIDGNLTVVNVLSEDSFRARHIPGSISIPADRIESLAPAKLPDRDREVIVYCASSSCLASDEAAEKLEEMGYRQVTHFEGGIAEWRKEGLPLEGDAV